MIAPSPLGPAIAGDPPPPALVERHPRGRTAEADLRRGGTLPVALAPGR